MSVGELGYALGYNYGIPILLVAALIAAVAVWRYRRRR